MTKISKAFVNFNNLTLDESCKYVVRYVQMEDLTRVVISYEIYETSLLCLLYDSLKWDCIAFKMNIISIRKRIVDMIETKRIVDMNVVNDVT